MSQKIMSTADMAYWPLDSGPQQREELGIGDFNHTELYLAIAERGFKD